MTTFQAVRMYYYTRNGLNGKVLDVISGYEPAPERRALKAAAIADGFKIWDHDDFNVAEWDGDKVVRVWWMDDDLSEADFLDELTEALR